MAVSGSILTEVVLYRDPWHAATRSYYGIKRKMPTRMRGITAGQLAKAASVNLETIRYYENIGLMPEPPRTRGGHRSYDEAHTRRLAFIRRARELGFTIEDVRALLALTNPEHTACAQVKEIALKHLMQVRSKIADLARLETILDATISRCTSEPTAHCPVLDMLEP
ncbi:helix-turn-helix domain-containing protein [Bosea sp. BIWAKO-01]|uniref:MerR family transcriptional regulator n=1 Tax=Bosea sp. BIWAKO-01 TaxID=506668 RepID=UPI000B0030A6